MTEAIAERLLLLKWRWHALPNRIAEKVAWWLPERLVYFVAIRLWAHASQKYADVEVGRITLERAIDAWEKDSELFGKGK